MDDRNDRKRDRLSWSEVDKLRDKSQKRDRDPMQKQSSPAAMNAQKSYRAALEKAFASGKIGELARTLGKGNEDGRPQPHTSQPLPQGPSAAAQAAQTSGAAGDAATVTPPLPPTPTAVVRDPERENKQKLLGKIREAESRDAVTRSVDAFLGKYEKLPDDVEILTKCLGHKSDDRLRMTLVQLTIIIERDKPRRARTLIAQLRMIEETHGDPEMRAQAGQVRARL
jgi:hypothetical protein